MATIEVRSDRDGGGFVIQELHAGASNGTFPWRVVAKRKEIPA